LNKSKLSVTFLAEEALGNLYERKTKAHGRNLTQVAHIWTIRWDRYSEQQPQIEGFGIEVSLKASERGQLILWVHCL
jgi:hypothetical protein